MTNPGAPAWTVLHISDPHLGLRSTEPHLRRAIESLRQTLHSMTPAPTVAVVTGDLSHHGDPEEYHEAHALLASLGIPVRVVPGNHDDLDALLTGPLRDMLGSHVTPFGAWHDTLHGLALFGLNSSRPGRSDGELGDEQLNWLAEHLEHQQGGQSLVLLHHPPVAVGNATMDAIRLADAASLAEVLRRSPPTAVLCGHVHRPIVAHLDHLPVLIASSLAWRTHLDLTPRADLMATTEPPTAFLHAWFHSAGLVTHQIPLVPSAIETPPRG